MEENIDISINIFLLSTIGFVIIFILLILNCFSSLKNKYLIPKYE